MAASAARGGAAAGCRSASMSSSVSSRRTAPASVVVFGSINVDLVIGVPALPTPGETVLAGGYELKPGGKGANQALAARRSAPGGERVCMVGRTGADGFASVALGNLLEAGVDTSWTGAADEDATGCAAVMVDECSGENQIVVGAAANLRASAGAHLRPALEAVAADGGRAVLVMQMEVPLPEVAAAIDIASALRVPTLLNVAPSTFIPPADALRKVAVLVVNEHEALAVARERFGYRDRGRIPKVAGYFLARKLPGTIVVVTLGAEGSCTFVPGAAADALAAGERPKIGPGKVFSIAASAMGFRAGERVVDTVGAGDAFVGALASSLAAGNDLNVSLRRATCAGGLACTMAGAQDASPAAATIDERAGEVRTEVAEWRGDTEGEDPVRSLPLSISELESRVNGLRLLQREP